MRPVMFKFNSDRQNKYRIMTVIHQDGRDKYVTKEALTDEANVHIQEIYNNYDLLRSIYPGIYICSADYKEGILYSEFIEGNEFSKKYNEAISHNSKEEFILALQEQKRLILSCDSDNFCGFQTERGFTEIFGDATPYLNQDAMKCSDFEFTSHNIIIKENGQNALIDYEYVFRFPVPISLILYHCVIKTNILTIEGFDCVFSVNELLDILEIQNTVDELETSWRCFQNYFGNGLIEKAKLRYLKSVYNISDIKDKLYRYEQEINGHLNYIDILTHNINKQQEYIQVLTRQLNTEKLNLQKNMEKVGKQEEEIKGHLNYIDILTLNLNKQHEYIEVLTQQLEIERISLEKNNANIRKQEEEIKGHINYISILTSNLQEQQKYINMLTCNLHDQQQKIDILTHEIEVNKCNVEKCESENERLLMINSEIMNNNTLLKTQIDSIENSISWKITGPVRKVLQLLNIRNK